MEKLKMHSPNFVDANIDKLAQLFPNCVTESKDDKGELKQSIDFDLLKQELSNSIVDGPQERYQLNWPGKREALLTANAPIAKTLRPCREESVDFDTTENLFIEGDNLDALKLLQETYLGKVKIIYIDPPYNTGKDFIYVDNFAETTEKFMLDSGQKDEQGNRLVANIDSNGRFHSDWLSMMYSRLKLARNLLKDDGVIFISIDDNEEHNIRKLCDEVFGADNLVGPLIHNKLNSKNDTVNVQRNHEYVVCYRKKTNYISATKIEPTFERKSNETKEVFKDGENFYFLNDPITTRGDGGTLNKRKNLGYTVYYNPQTSDFIGIQDYDIELAQTSNNEEEVYSSNNDLLNNGYIKIRPPKVRGKLGAWTWDINKFNNNRNEILIKQTKNGYSVRKRTFLSSPIAIEKDGKYYVRHEKITNSRSIIEFSTNDGSTQLSELLGNEGLFSNPKNVNLIKYLINLLPQKDFIALDFFAGSAASSHAVMQLNAEDNGKRKFIMVQLPEACDEKSEAFKAGYKTIAEISKERIRRAGKKIINDNKNQSVKKKKEECGKSNTVIISAQEAKNLSNLDTGFRVLKIDSTNMADVYYTPDTINQDDLFASTDNIKEDRTSEDLLFQVLIDWGVDLTLPISRELITIKDSDELENECEVFFVDNNSLAACFEKDGKITEDFCKILAERQPLRVVFRDSGFKDDSVKINVEQIFKLMSPHTDIKTI